MAKTRVVNTRFWNDPWVMEVLNPLDKFLFLYFLTNDQTNLSGIYEISPRKICFETGIERETLLKAMLPRLEPKVYFEEDWVIIPNFPKHQNTENPKIMAGIQRELENVPKKVYEKAIAYGYPIPLNYTIPNSTKPFGSVSDETKGEEEERGVRPSFEVFIEDEGVTSDYEGDGEVADKVYRRNGKVVALKALQREYEKLYPAPVTLKKAPQTRDSFDFDTWLDHLANSTNKVEKIIAHIWSEKGYRFENYEQWRAQMGQDKQFAQQLIGYSGKQIAEAIRLCQKDSKEKGYEWKASTVAKKIAEIMV